MTSREKIIYDRNITEGNFKKSNELKKGSALNCLEEMKKLGLTPNLKTEEFCEKIRLL